MKRKLFLVIAIMVFAVGCSKKKKNVIPFFGSSNETATSQSNTGVGTANASATGAGLASISVTPAEQSIAKDTQATYTATGIYTDGTFKDITSECSWAVTAEADKITAETNKGRFTGKSPTSGGKITAAYGSITGAANLKVTSATLTSIEISSVPSLIPGGTATYIAIGIFSDGTTQDISNLVTWSSSNSSSVSIDPITGVGTGGTSTGIATITATVSATSFPNVAAGTTTTDLKNATIVSITVTGQSNLGTGAMANYMASAIYSDGTSSDITNQATWSLNDSSLASISDTAGTKGALTAVAAGSVTLQATYAGSNGTKVVTISALTVSSVTVSPSVKTIVNGTTTQFTATASYSDGTTANVTKSAVWSSSNTAVAGVNTSTSTGGLSQGISAGTATITATVGGKSGTAALTVSSATLVSIAITGADSDGSIARGTSNQFTATGTYSDGSTQDITSLVTWSSSASAVASISNASNIKGLASASGTGSSTIQASLNGVTSNSATLTVTSATLSFITIDGNTSIEVGATKQYTATGTFSDASSQIITSLVTWNSASITNATISNASSDKGKAYGLVVGTSNITATLPNGANGIATTGSATITSNTSELTIGTVVKPVVIAPVVISGVKLEVSSGTNTETNPSGAFDGALLIIGDQETKGFIANITSGTLQNCANVTCLMDKILQSISEDDFDFNGTNNTNSILETPANGGYNLVTRKTVSGTVIPTEIASVEIKLNTTKNLPETNQIAPHSVNDMRNHYVNLVGRVDGSGTITDLPSKTSGVSTSTTFRIEIQASKNSTSTLIMLGITTKTNFDIVEIPLTSLVNGTNIAPSSYSKASGSKNFASSGPPKVDFLISVNNSATMSGEQSGLQTSLASFFARLKSLGTDFRVSVITSDCDQLWKPDTVLRGFSSGQHQTCQPTGVGTGEGINDWGTGINYFDDSKETEFNTTIGKIGIRGWSTESNLLYAEKAIASGGTFTQVRSANGRSSVPMTVIVITDDPDQYDTVRTELTSAGLTAPANVFNKDSNEFVSQSVTVHTVSPLDSSGIPATCTGPNGNTSEMSNFDATPDADGNGIKDIYEISKNISTKTGGMASTICASNPSSFMELIADQAAAGASTYSLDHVPITNTLQVRVNGTLIEMGIASLGTTKFIYNSTTNKISFTGTIPAASTPFTVSYSYYTSGVSMDKLSGNSNFLAYISKTAKSSTARGFATGIALLVGAILAGRIWRRKE